MFRPKASRIDALFFESYSFSKVILHARSVRRAKVVLIFRDTYLGDRQYETGRQQSVRRLACWLNPRAQVRAVRMEEVADRLFGASAEAVRLLEAEKDRIRKTAAYRLLHGVVGSDQVVKFYQMWLVRRIPYRYVCARLCEALREENKNVVVVSDGSMGFWRGTHPLLQGPGEEGVSAWSRFVAGATNALRAHGWRLMSLLLPGVLFLRHLRNGRASSEPPRYGLAMPVMHGVFDREKVRTRDIRTQQDDAYLYRHGFRPGEIVHVFGDWKLSPEVKKKFAEEMRRRGYRYVDKDGYGVNLALLRFTLACTWRVAKSLLDAPGASWLSATMEKATTKALYSYILKQYEMENVKYDVELVRNEYNAGHVVESIVANRDGRKRVGVVHSGTIHSKPENSFVHLDKLMVLCRLHAKTFSPHWRGVAVEEVGRHTMDSLLAESRNREKIIADIGRLHGRRRWVVTILLPGVGAHNMLAQWDKLFEALADFPHQELDCHVFLRFRLFGDAKNARHISRFFDLPGVDSRFIIEHERWTTHQLMVGSDLVITPSSSWGINEASVVGARVFSFLFIGMEPYNFRDYGADFVLREARDVLDAFRGLESGFEGFDCAWERLRMDSDYHFDGKNTERMASVLRQEMQAS